MSLMMSWTEYERGWGQRPNGYSFHKNKDAFESFLEKHIFVEERNANGEVPDEYSRPSWDEPKTVSLGEWEELAINTIGDIWLAETDLKRDNNVIFFSKEIVERICQDHHALSEAFIKMLNRKKSVNVLCWMMEWTETERGYGQRPDGASFHMTSTGYLDFLKDIRQKEFEIYKGATPETYSVPSWSQAKSVITDPIFAALVRKDGDVSLMSKQFAIQNGILTITDKNVMNAAMEAFEIQKTTEEAKLFDEIIGSAKASHRNKKL